MSGQVLVHQRVTPNSAIVIECKSTKVTSTANALVDIHDSAPTTGQSNYAAVEIVATLQ